MATSLHAAQRPLQTLVSSPSNPEGRAESSVAMGMLLLTFCEFAKILFGFLMGVTFGPAA